MQEMVDGPRAERAVGVHDDNAPLQMIYTKRLIEEVLDVFMMMQRIKENNVGKTATGKRELLRIRHKTQTTAT
jgi:hypothetical protein